MNFIKILFFFGLIPFLTLTVFSQTNPLNGVWKYQEINPEKSLKKINFVAQSNSNFSFSAPESLILVIDENEATINEIFTEIVKTRTVKTEPLQNPKHSQPSVNLSKKRLKIETLANDGKRITEIYETFGNKLKVTIQLNDVTGQKLLTEHRVYQRSLSEIYDSDSLEN